jgi:biotin operon repressor
MLKDNNGMSLTELADTLNIASATASKSLKASGWQIISELNGYFINQVKGLKHV